MIFPLEVKYLEFRSSYRKYNEEFSAITNESVLLHVFIMYKQWVVQIVNGKRMLVKTIFIRLVWRRSSFHRVIMNNLKCFHKLQSGIVNG